LTFFSTIYKNHFYFI